MKIDSERFQVKEGEKVRLDNRPTHIKPLYSSKDEYRDMLADHVGELSKIQDMMYAHDRYSLLVIFQAMDAAGKDSAISMSCQESTRRAVLWFPSSIPALKNSTTTSYGALLDGFRNVGRSEFSIVLIMKKC
jgi:polyphosphate kinase 2 (PPK2 family)